MRPYLVSAVGFVVFSVVAGAVAAAGSSAAPSTGADAVCQLGGPSSAGPLRAGVYTTRCFVPGLQVTVPSGGWQAAEDSPVEFKLLPPNAQSQDTPAIRFWIDPHAAPACTTQFLPVDVSTPTKIVDC